MKITKLKLINWMYFHNTTIEFDGNTIITGDNGSGKSTIIDALQFILHGGVQGLRLNSAADERTHRTVENYVRGLVNFETDKYLRKRDVISHLAIEIEQNNHHFVVGVCITYKQALECEYYLAKPAQISDDLFISHDAGGSQVKTLSEMESAYRSHGGKISFYSSPSSYRDALGNELNIDIKRYIALLPKSIAFRSISKIDDFMANFFLDECPVPYANLQAPIDEMQKIQGQLEEARKKIEELQSIVDLGEDLTKLNCDMQYYGYLKTSLELKQQEKSILETEKLIKTRSDELEEIENHITICIQELEKLEKNINKIALAMASNGRQDAIIKLEYDIKLTRKEIDDQQKIIDNLTGLLAQETIVARQLQAIKKEPFSSYYLLLEEKNFSALTGLTSDYLKAKEELRDSVMTELAELSVTERDLLQQEDAIQDQIGKLKNKLHTINGDYLALKEAIRKHLKELTGRDIAVTFLYEHLRIKDQRWRNAVEGFLGSKRFDIVVDKEYFKAAVSVYSAFRDSVFGIGVINLGYFASSVPVRGGSLTEKIFLAPSTNQNIQNYAFSLLNSIICVESEGDFEGSQAMITPSCMTYQHGVARKINPRHYRDPFIGEESFDVQLKNRQSELKLVQEKIAENRKKTLKVKSLIEIFKMKGIEDHNISEFDAFATLSKKQEELADLTLRLKLLKDNEYLQLEKEKQQLLIKKAQIGDMKDNYLQRKGEVKNLLQILSASLTEKQNGYSELLNGFRQLSLPDEILERLAQEVDGASPNQVFLTIRKIDDLRKTFNQKNEELVRLMSLYSSRHSFIQAAGFHVLDQFQGEYSRLKNTALVAIEEQAKKTGEVFLSVFHNYFVGHMQQQFEQASNNVSAINRLLAGKKFGEDEYRISFRKALDPTMARYYEALKNLPGSYDHNFLSNEYDHIIKEIVDKITSPDSELLDYRNYISLDIKITSPQGERSQRSVKLSQSGGEGQVPYYIIAAACFQNLIKLGARQDSRLCVVLFDEAFNNMDTQRITQMMEYYKGLDIQLIISLTAEKLHSVCRAVKSTVIVSRSGNTSYAQGITYTGDADYE